jgi:putative alpha-1,2-mannosidase
LKELFDRSFYWNTKWLPNPYYWAGNEHDLFSVWLFPFVNRSDLTQKYSRKILEVSYGIDGAGLPGNDDYGTMSAWLIWAGLGLYPVPSKNIYVLGSPVIHSARIYRKMSGGKMLAFNVNVQNNSVKKHKVNSVSLNGNVQDRFVTYEDLSVQNSVLNFNFEI